MKTWKPRIVYLDLTHVGRHVTGIERIAIELFERVGFDNAVIRPVRANGTLSMIFKQQVWLPLVALLQPGAAFVFPGFPPSPFFALCRNRTVLYVHDLFLMTRWQDLSLKAKLYMALPFRIAVRSLKYFFVNSKKTAGELRAFAKPDAQIGLYRPMVKNVFDLSAGNRARDSAEAGPLRLAALGTVEPRKNYTLAADIRDMIEERLGRKVELHIIGRQGWGGEGARLAARPGVIIHGYLETSEVREILERSDLYLCTSHDEGLGLPLLEAQYAGLGVLAPDKDVFREVLGTSGHYFPAGSAAGACETIKRLLSMPDGLAMAASASLDNVQRWNINAESDLKAAQGIFRDTAIPVTLAYQAGDKA